MSLLKKGAYFYFSGLTFAHTSYTLHSMNDISTLPKTTFSGRRFTRKQLKQVQKTVQMFNNLSRNELALTICEHLNWKTPGGKLKVNSALTLLEKLESYDIVTLPAKKKSKPPVRHEPAFVEPPDTTCRLSRYYPKQISNYFTNAKKGRARKLNERNYENSWTKLSR